MSSAQSPKTFFPTANEAVNADLERRGRILLILLKSYEGLGGVHQRPGGFNRDYFFADMEGVNKYLGKTPRGPDYGAEQPAVSMAFREAWGWLEKESCLIRTPGQPAQDWFSITPTGEKLWAKAIRFEQWEKDGLSLVRSKLNTDPLGKIGGTPEVRTWAADWVKMKESQTVSSPELADDLPSAEPQHLSETSIIRNLANPKAFLSYSWDSPEHRLWVQNLASRLRTDGVETILDRWHLRPGHDKFAFMESAISDADFVLIICSITYAEKANKRDGGVGYEATIITLSLAGKVTQTKFVPLLRSGSWDEALPHWLKSRIGFDLRGAECDTEYQSLLDHLHGTTATPPLIGKRQSTRGDETYGEPPSSAHAVRPKLMARRDKSPRRSSPPPKEPILQPTGIGSLMQGNALIQTIAIDNIQLATQNSAVATDVKIIFKHAGLESSVLMDPGIWLPRENDLDRVPTTVVDIKNECRANIAYLAQDGAKNLSFIWWHQNSIAVGKPPDVGNWRAVVSLSARNCKFVRFRIAFRITAEHRLADQKLICEPADFSSWLNFQNIDREIDELLGLELTLTAEQLLYDIATNCRIYPGSNDRPAIVMPRPGNAQPRTAGQVDMAVVQELFEKGVIQTLSGDDMLCPMGVAYYDNFLKFPV